MKNIYTRILVSLILGILISWIFLWGLSFIINSGDIVGIIMGIATISTIIFCTLSIIQEIKNKK
jgi:hypothetical protein